MVELADGQRVTADDTYLERSITDPDSQVVKGYREVLIPELNTGQLAMLIRARFLIDAKTYSKVQGQPIFADELEEAISELIG